MRRLSHGVYITCQRSHSFQAVTDKLPHHSFAICYLCSLIYKLQITVILVPVSQRSWSFTEIINNKLLALSMGRAQNTVHLGKEKADQAVEIIEPVHREERPLCHVAPNRYESVTTWEQGGEARTKTGARERTFQAPLSSDPIPKWRRPSCVSPEREKNTVFAWIISYSQFSWTWYINMTKSLH